MLVTDLSQSPDVEVLSTDRLVQILRDLGKLEDRAISFETIQEVARRAHVKHVLLGSYVKAGEAIRINVRLQDAPNGRIISTERVDAVNEASLFPTLDDLTRRVKARFASSSGTMLTGLLSTPGARPTNRGLDRDLKDVTTSSMEAYRHYAAGIEQHQRGRYREALPHLQAAVKVDPDFALAYVKMAVVSGNLGRSNERDQYAQRALDLVNRLTPRERYYIEGYYYSTRVDTSSRAIEAYEKVLALYPDHSASRNNLGLMYLRTDQLDKAIEHYSVLRERGFEFPGAAGNLAAAYVSSGKPDTAVEVMREFIARYPDLESAHFNLGLILLMVNRFDEAQAAFDKALALRPSFAPPQNFLAMTAMLRDDFTMARQIGERLAGSELPSARHLGFLDLAYTDLLQGRTREAVKHLQRAIDGQGPGGSNESATARAVIAEILLAQKQKEAAAAEALRSIADSKGRLAVLDGLLIGSFAGSPEARAELNRVAAALPAGSDKATPLLVDAVLAVEAGRHAAALDLLQRFSPHVPPGPIGAPVRQPLTMIAYWTARARLGLGEDAEAARHFAKVTEAGYNRMESQIEYVRSFYYLGQIADRAGDRAKAREYYGRFLKYWKDGDIDRDKVQEALKYVNRT